MIAASLKDLEGRVAQQSFRADLYHRLHVLRIEIPPPRDRPDDILLLAENQITTLKLRYRMPQSLQVVAHPPIRHYFCVPMPRWT